ncbi:uncharacterized protein LACBIDRAFT_328395 [Laccaria bicolor S238N-H82]|uniref:Predicted protein n=1 Tax=Laccaria bicolor (strain S238N-H82 / ATCC MYA-4686) TaxID=486041 RepID=B0DER4_LACBS|nr:uncharacterized protein LACBIDRAFT_328395 [Laccaria bicolor S238N-H82]EDR07072.1 predicted protein [Laccaria bicolor S238N-H82]|eukprot:XP_001882445.1 predicted protein [Laccaria bicolor S238N-H82]
MQAVFDGLLRGTCVHNKGDDNDFTRINLPPIQLELRSAFAMSENALLSVASLLHSDGIATLPRLGELAFSWNGTGIDDLCAPFYMSVWNALGARAHQLSRILF